MPTRQFKVSKAPGNVRARAGAPAPRFGPGSKTFSDALPAGATTQVRYDVEAYENTGRPDALGCTGCSLGTGCEYDSGNHTTPVYELSAALTLFR